MDRECKTNEQKLSDFNYMVKNYRIIIIYQHAQYFTEYKKMGPCPEIWDKGDIKGRTKRYVG